MDVLDREIEVIKHFVGKVLDHPCLVLLLRPLLTLLGKLLPKKADSTVDKLHHRSLPLLFPKVLMGKLAKDQHRIDCDDQWAREQVLPRNFEGETFD